MCTGLDPMAPKQLKQVSSVLFEMNGNVESLASLVFPWNLSPLLSIVSFLIVMLS